MTMVVRNWRVDEQSAGFRVSADVGDKNVWFALPPGIRPRAAGDAFCAVALLPAMARGEDLDLTAIPSLSAGYVERLERVQEIWTCWNPLLKRIAIRASAGAPLPAAVPGGAAFFSGGVDAVFTALARRSAIDRLVLVNGFDFNMSPDEFAAARARAGRLADRIGVPLVTVETNWIEFTRHHRIARITSFGSGLAGIALAMAPERMIIASSNSYARLAPTGSHPLVDPLWSNGITVIEHHGCYARRDEKLAAIAEQPDLLRDLWVCHFDPVGNCGSCPKCLRLRVGLWLLGKDQQAFPGASGDAVVAWCKVARHRSERLFIEELITQARACGREGAARRLARTARGIRLRGFLRTADTLLLRGAIGRRRTRSGEAPDLMPWGAGSIPEA